MINWLQDIDNIELSTLPGNEPLVRKERTCTLSQATFERIGDYTRSQPTTPSAGRVYRKNLNPNGDLQNWFIYIVIDDPAGDGQLNVPYRVVLNEV